MQNKNLKLLVGTSKGLIEFSSESDWAITNTYFEALPVNFVYADGEFLVAAINHRHWGQKLHLSKDGGKSWEEKSIPMISQNGSTEPVKRIWYITKDPSQSDRHWIGVEPAALFHASDNFEKFSLVESLWNLASRKDKQKWFGAGRDHPFLHTVEVSPQDLSTIFVGVSSAGIFKSEDGGVSWFPKNKGLRAAYLPNTAPDIGHDPHRLIINRLKPNVIWQQNHCGIYRSTDGGDLWVPCTEEGQTPHYGFGLVIDHSNPDVAWVIPAESDTRRIPPGAKLTVFKTEDGGLSWQSKSKGLSTLPSYDIVLRHSFNAMDHHMAFGTNSGNVYLSSDDGEHWNLISHHLSKVESICFTNV